MVTRKQRRNAKKPAKMARLRQRAKVERPRLQSMETVLWFGEYKKLTVRELCEKDMPYVRWLASCEPESRRMRYLVEFLRTIL